MLNHRERRDRELPYISDGSVLAEQFKAKLLLRSFNRSLPFNVPKEYLLFKLLGLRHGKGVYIEPPFRCDYGKHIEIGDNFYANSGCIIIDVAPVRIGDNVMFGPNVAVITAGHPIHHEIRNTKYEYGISINIGSNVWIGANTVVLPGVNIGENSVIGAGSVVTKDIPSGVVAVGNPCKPIREITEEDKLYYYKKRRFDDEAWEEIQKIISDSDKQTQN